MAMSVTTVILAAGGGRRMGQPKQLLLVAGQPMLARVVQTVCAAQLGQVIVVLGASASAVQPVLAGYQVSVVINAGWKAGMASSLRAGLSCVSPAADGALFVPGDMPRLRPGLLQGIVAHFYASGKAIVVPTYQGQRGNPVLFACSLFAELAALQGDQGGRALLASHASDIAFLETDDEGILHDIDTPADYVRLIASPMD
jgi:molybdenum cofactor cytidylyltransferase